MPEKLPSALSTCLSNVSDLRKAMESFQAQGYRYEPEDFGGGPDDVLHWYISADGSIIAGISFGSTHDGNSCRISTDGMNVGQALPYTKAVAEQILGVTFQPGTPSGKARSACNIWTTLPGKTVHIEVGSHGQDPMCAANEPAQIMIHARKG